MPPRTIYISAPCRLVYLIPASCRTPVQPLGNVPLLTTIPATRRFFSKLWRLSIFFLSSSAPHHNWSYQLYSTGVLLRVSFFHRRPYSSYLSHFGALAITKPPSMTLVLFSDPTLTSTCGQSLPRRNLKHSSHWSYSVFAASAHFCHLTPPLDPLFRDSHPYQFRSSRPLHYCCPCMTRS